MIELVNGAATVDEPVTGEQEVLENNRQLLAANEALETEIAVRMQVETGLRESEERFRVLAEQSSDLISLHAPDGVWQYASPAARSLFGYEPADLVGCNAFELVHPDDIPPVARAHQSILRDRTSSMVSFRFRAADGRYVWVEAIGKAICDPQTGELSQLMCSMRDITKRKETEERAQQVQADLALADRLTAIGNMISTLAHDINQPLASIANYAQACARQMQIGPGVTPAMLEAAQRITVEALRAGEIIRRLRQFAGRTAGRREKVNINDLIREVRYFVQAEARRVGVSLRKNLAADLPLIEVDAVQIQQVLVNVIRNALEALSEPMAIDAQAPRDTASPERVIDIETSVELQKIIVRVRDTGRAIPPETLAKMFEPHFTTKRQGLGLGLSISRSLVEAHGGRLIVIPQPTGGLCVQFDLPIQSQRSAS
jgi:PAS domain S-box-containing protein